MQTLTVDVVSDVVCPWCLIGTRRLQQVLSERPDVTATVTFHPFLLDPSTPDAGGDLREHLAKKYGADPDKMFGRVEAVARETGIPLDFAKVRRFAPTVRAHTLLRHADEKGTQVALVNALFEAYFLEGKDIGQATVLAQIASSHGFTADEATALLASDAELQATREEAASAAAQGITGVPFFVFGGKFAFSGAQPKEVFAQAIEKALAAG
jgi:predicted DsbA family dithiol-disulfide isomerase